MSIMQDLNSGYNQYVAPTVNTIGSGLYDAGSAIGTHLNTNMDSYKAGTDMFGAYTKYQNMRNTNDINKGLLNMQIDDRDRAIEREELAEGSMSTGFGSAFSGKKKPSNYYGV